MLLTMTLPKVDMKKPGPETLSTHQSYPANKWDSNPALFSSNLSFFHPSPLPPCVGLSSNLRRTDYIYKAILGEEGPGYTDYNLKGCGGKHASTEQEVRDKTSEPLQISVEGWGP